MCRVFINIFSIGFTFEIFEVTSCNEILTQHGLAMLYRAELYKA
jgi:hypothetical protein